MGSQLRMSGLISGLDTDAIISSLVSVKKLKVTNTKGEQTKLSWKQEIWKDLNKELKSLQSAASNMRFSTAYQKKTVKASDSSKVSVIASDGATDSVQSLQIKNLAKTAYMTGGQVTEDGSATALTKMSDLGSGDSTSFNVVDKKGNVKETINIDGNTTISDVLTGLKKAGLNASFDEKNQRFFISAKESGADADFSFAPADDKAQNALTALGLTEAPANAGKDAATKYATKIKGEDAEIYLNGAYFKNSNNVFNINGLTITALGKTTGDEEITLTTQNDNSGIYDSIKKFLTSYNNIINKLDKVYNADRAKGFNPLTDEEKEAMSESEAEKYEQKIKDSLLRGDSTVNSIVSALTEATSNSFKVGDKTMHLSDFGIGTLSYFVSGDNEKHALHIDGDADDEKTSGNADKLLSMISNDPDAVVSFFTQMSQDIYSKMDKLSSSVQNQRSFGSFFEDKKMKTDYDSYNSKISSLEEKLNAYEDKLYKQYAAMEKALAKLQSNSTAVTGLLGMQ